MAALAFAGKSVATPAISFLVTTAFNYLNKFRSSQGLEEVESRLRQSVPKIRAVFDAVNPERIREQSAALDEWLWQLRDAIEEAEDAVDMLKYYELKEKARDRKVSDCGSSFAKMKHKAVKTLTHASIVDKTIKPLTHHDTVKKLRKAVENLDKAAAGVADFLSVVGHLEACNVQQRGCLTTDDRETGAMPTETRVFGRDKDKRLVVRWLTTPDEDAEIMERNKHLSDEDAGITVSNKNLSIVSIVGHGGMGKTTLAQLICRDSAITNNFDKVIWVCVSTSFNAKTIITNILQSATWKKPDVDTLGQLQEVLSKNLNSLKFLLILDDVWEDKNSDQWDRLLAPLKEGKSGSKILLTTRMQSVADLAMNLMGAKQKSLQLQGLAKNDTIKLFNHHAFSNLRIQDYTHLQSIGEQIATKVTGCPLVIKVVGAHLRDNRTVQYWNNFLHQSLEHFEGNAEDIMKVLKLSYYHLPTELQTCFRYCSIFPQDYVFEREKLVNMWIGSGLISQETREPGSLSDTGEDYLVQLTKKSFFDLRCREDHLGLAIEEYIMHDLMHDLANYVSLGECARVVDAGSFENIAITTRHLLVQDVGKFSVKEVQKISKLKHLRTIVIMGNELEVMDDILNTVEKEVGKLKTLRLLETNLFHTPDFIGKLANLKHLRYIRLHRIVAQISINGIVKLYHLTVLACDNVKIEPKQVEDIENLDLLRYVTYGSGGFGNIPIARLTCLRFLEHYEVQQAKGYTVSALKDLKSLRTLGIKGLENVENCEEAKNAKLKEKQHLSSLSLQWSGHDGAQSMRDDLILDDLEPNANLRNLEILGYTGTRIPYWIAKASVKNLISLNLESCIKWEQLPSLAEFLVLRYLRLDKLSKLKSIGESYHASCSQYVESTLPPYLHTLEVSGCQELGELPLLPPGLVSFIIRNVGLNKIPSIGKKPHNESDGTRVSQLQEVRIISCSCLTSLEGSFFEQKQYMGTLKYLHIDNCIHLESASSLAFEEMNELTYLIMRSCGKLRASREAGEMLLASSLRTLSVESCGNLELSLLGSLHVHHQLANLVQLHLKNCSSLVSLPSAQVFSRTLTSLRGITIEGCGNLSSLGGLGSLPFLFALDIRCCSKLTEVGSSQSTPRASGGDEEHPVDFDSKSSLRISDLTIDLSSLLLVEPLKSLCHTKHLVIENASEMESLPDRWLLQNRQSLQYLWIRSVGSLELLPPNMRHISSLQDLRLFGASQLRSLAHLPPSLKRLTLSDVGPLNSLPDLPSSLKRLDILGCNSELEKKIAKRTSPERNKISHILQVRIGCSSFIMGKKCCGEIMKRVPYMQDEAIYSLLNKSKHRFSQHFCLQNIS